MHRLLALLFIVAISPVLAVPHQSGQLLPAPQEIWDEDWAQLLSNLRVLTEGSAADRQALIEETGVFGLFEGLEAAPDEGEQRWVIDTIRDWMGHEEDAWVLYRALARLHELDVEGLEPLLRDLSTHPVPSLRHHAFEYAASLDDEEEAEAWFEELWAQESVPWLQAALLHQLYLWGFEFPLEDCTRLIEAEDPEVAGAAMDCAADFGMPEAGEALIRVALYGEPLHRRAALRRVPDWCAVAEDDEALAMVSEAVERLWQDGVPYWLESDLLAALQAVGSGLALPAAREVLFEHEEVALAAVSLLGLNISRSTTKLLVRRAASGPDAVRVAAIEALDPPPWDPAVDALIELSLNAEQPKDVKLAAISAIQDWDIYRRPPGGFSEQGLPFRSLLEDLAWSDEDPKVRRRARECVERVLKGITVVTFSCLSDTPYPSFAISAQEPAASARCWRQPGREPDPGMSFRVGDGGRALENERYDDGEVLWREFRIIDGRCWVPAHETRLIMPYEGETLPGATRALLEFDLPRELVQGEPFRRLERLHLLSTFDEGETLVGVRLNLDVSEKALEALRSAGWEWSGTLLGHAVRSVLKEMADRPEELQGWDAWQVP